MVDTTVLQAYRFALDPTAAQVGALRSHQGAARVAFNRMLAEVKSTLTAREWERRLLGGCLTPSQGWSLPALRRTWNALKHDEFPWWAENSKEAYNTGLGQLSDALSNWADARAGARKGGPVGFPRFRRKSRAQSVRFTTGVIRVEADRRHVRLPVLGRIHTHESTRSLARRLEAGTARILSATVKQDSRGRWWVSFGVEVQRAVGHDARPAHARRLAPAVAAVGVDVGVCDLLVAADGTGREVLRVPAPRSLAGIQNKLRRLQRAAARQQRGSARRRATAERIGRLHGRAAAIRRDIVNKTTTALTQGCDVLVIEDLNVAGMGARKTGLGARGRGFNRAIADAALGELRRQLTYKATWYGSRLVVADRWFPSSKTCSACGARKPSLHLSQRTYRCDACGVAVDRDLNAAVNLARLGVPSAGSGPGDANDGLGADRDTDPAQAGDAGGHETSTLHRPRAGQTGTAPPQGEAA